MSFKARNKRNKRLSDLNNNKNNSLEDNVVDNNEDKIADQIVDQISANLQSIVDFRKNKIRPKDGLKSDDKTKRESDVKPEDNPMKDLHKKIVENDSYFSSLIDLIPPKIYFEGNEEILESMENQKRQRFSDDKKLSAKAKQKRLKLDPNSNKRVSQIAEEFYNNSNENNSKNNKMSELRQKLEEKISKLKSIRGQKSNAKQLRESKKERKKLNSLRASKQKGFSKRQLLDTNNNENSSEPKPKKVKFEHNISDNENKDENSGKIPKIYNKEGNIVYSKFDFVSQTNNFQNKINSKKNKLKTLLVKTKKEEEKISQLETTNASKAKAVKVKKLWRNAIEKSEGIKVKDNSKLIEKSLNNKKKKKQKSTKKWNERKESLDKTMKAKSDKRKDNIDKRKQQRKDKHLKRAHKKGRLLGKK